MNEDRGMRIGVALLLLGTAGLGCRRDAPLPSEPYVIVDDAMVAEEDAQVAATPQTSPTVADAAPIAAGEAQDAAGPNEKDGVDAEEPPITDAQLDIDFGPCFGDCPTYTLHLRDDGAFSGPGGKRQLGQPETQAIFRLVDDAFAKGIGRCLRPTDVQYITVTYRHLKVVRTTRYAAMHPCSPKIAEAVRRVNALRGRK